MQLRPACLMYFSILALLSKCGTLVRRPLVASLTGRSEENMIRETPAALHASVTFLPWVNSVSPLPCSQKLVTRKTVCDPSSALWSDEIELRSP